MKLQSQPYINFFQVEVLAIFLQFHVFKIVLSEKCRCDFNGRILRILSESKVV